MKYSIIHVNNRAKEKIKHNQNILSSFDYIDDIEYINGNEVNAFDILNNLGIDCYAWKPYDGRTSDALPGEYGVWVSTINVWQYMIKHKVDRLLVLEDDITLKDDFINTLDECIKDLPEDFDFLSLYYFDEQNDDLEETEIGSNNIKKSYNQYSAGQATFYSLSGAKKLFKLIKRKGLEYTSDCFIFKQSELKLVNGYSIKGNHDRLLTHEYNNIKSLIDPNNLRNNINL